MGVLLRTAAVDQLRRHWVRTTRGRWESGVLLEPQRTNFLLRSQEFGSASWAKVGCSISVTDSTAAPAPDGTNTAELFQEDTSTGGHALEQSYTGSASASQVLSVYARLDGRSWLMLALDDGTVTNRIRAFFHLAAGAVASVSNAGTGSGATAWMERVDGAWWRLILTGIPHTGGTTYRAVIAGATGDGGQSYTGASLNIAYVWGAQAENNATFPTSYVPTGAATAVRSTDDWSRTLVGTPAETPQPMTCYLRGVLLAPWAQFPSFRYPFSIGQFTAGERLLIGKGSADEWRFTRVNAAGTQTARGGVNMTAAVAGDVLELRGVLGADGGVLGTVARNHGTPIDFTGTGTVPLPPSWAAPVLGTTTYDTPWMTTHAVILPGAATLETCRAAAGVAA